MSSSLSHKAQYIQVTTSDNNENESENNSNHKTQIELTNINTSSSSSTTTTTLYNDNKGVNVNNTKEDTSLIEHDNTVIDLPIEKDITLSSQTTQIMKYNKALKGNMFLCCYDKNGTPLICIGPHCM